MALTIHQKPLYDLLHAGDKIIYTLKDLNAVTSFVKVKYIARVYVATMASDLGTTGNLAASSLVATLKTNPNAAGVGIFDLSPILDNYVSPDFEGGSAESVATAFYSNYKSTGFDTQAHDIHTIDEFCSNQNACRYVKVIFNTEYAVNLTSPVIETTNYKTADELLVFNGFLEHHEILKETSGNFGYNLSWNGYIMNGNTDKFLTEAPTKQYIRLKDYATIAFFNNLANSFIPSSFSTGTAGSTLAVKYMRIQYYYNGSTQGAAIDTEITGARGALQGNHTADSNRKIHYYGVGTANQNNAGISIPANWDYYTLQAYDSLDAAVSQVYEFHKQEDDCKGYETIRLCWINKFGTWDYYNFTQKTIRTFSKEAVSYQSMDGTWNTDKFKLEGYKGGKKIFKSKATELITLNTNFITDDEAIWLESLFISNNVYILKQNSNDAGNQAIVRKYIEPVIIASDEMERQTTSNNGKKQYTLTISKSKNRKTQRT